MAENPRQSLERFYSLRGQLPAELIEKINPGVQPAVSPTAASKSAFERQERAIAEIFKDPRITLEQREKISNSILNGSFELVSSTDGKHRSKPRIIMKDHEKLRVAELTVKRHELPKQNFLEVVTQSAPIPILSGKVVRAQKVALQVQQGGRSPTTAEMRERRGLMTADEENGFPGEGEFVGDQHASSRRSTAKQLSMKELQNQLVAEHNK